MVKVDRKTWKKNYFLRLYKNLEEFPRLLLVNVDNVGSKQLQNIRIALRGKCELLMGKNTLIRRAILNSDNSEWQNLLPHVKGNVGLLFTNMDAATVRDILIDHKVDAPARVGAIAPADIIIAAGPTGQDAQKTSFFQALNIPTKIAKGSIEIVSDVKLLEKDARVGPSEAALLNMLGQSPFKYGAEVVQIFEGGACFGPAVLDITEADLLGRVMEGASRVAAVSLAISYPNAVSVPHMLVNGYKNVLAIAVATDITFPLAEKAKAFLENPEAFLVAAAAAAPAAAAPAAAAAPEPEEEDEDEDMDGFSLFD
jgi:large subunit ribosomal protein LP0